MGIPFSKGDFYSRGKGRQYITASALKAADIIVSTSTAVVSQAIRDATVSPVSHAALYIGQNFVVEAILQGVRKRKLSTALSESVRVIAYRHRNISTTKAAEACSYASSQRGRGYDAIGAIVSGDPKMCGVFGSKHSFFCSELVVQAFTHVGLPLTDKSAQCSTPDDVFVSRYIQYVGHLK